MQLPTEIQRVTFTSKDTIEIIKVPAPAVDESTVVFKTICSGISAGTEMSLLNMSIPSFNKKWSDELSMFQADGTGTKKYPVFPGYENVSEVLYVGSEVSEVKVGDVLWIDAPHQDYTFANIKDIPHFAIEGNKQVEKFTTLVLLRVALAGVHDSGMVLGDSIFISGCGAVGLLTAEIARLSGAQKIVISDPIGGRRKLAEKYGYIAIDPTRDSFYLEAKQNSGFDVSIETSGTAVGLQACIKLAKRMGRIVVTSTIREPLSEISLAEEFSRNGLTMISSMSINGCLHKKYPLWDLQRLNATAFSLIKKGKIDTLSLITHRIPFTEAARAYELLQSRENDVFKIIFTY